MAQSLLIQRMQNGVTGTISRRAGPLSGAFTVVGSHAAKRPLVDFALFSAGERHTVVLQFDHRRNGFAAHVLNGVLIAQPVGAFHSVVEMPLPQILTHIGQRRRHAALRRDRVAAGGENFGQARCLQALLGHTEGRAQTRTARADHDHIVVMID